MCKYTCILLNLYIQMSVCVGIFVHAICINVAMYVCVYVCIHLSMYVFTYHVPIQWCMYVFMYSCKCDLLCMLVHVQEYEGN